MNIDYDHYIFNLLQQDNLEAFLSLAEKGIYPLFVGKEEQPNIYYLEKIIYYQRIRLLDYVLSKCKDNPIDLNDNMKYYLFTLAIKNDDLLSFQILLESFYPSRELLEQLYTYFNSKYVNKTFSEFAIPMIFAYHEKYGKRGEKRKSSSD